jgi:copper chaperone
MGSFTFGLIEINHECIAMISFEVSDMTCGHCASSIAKAIRSVDEGSEVQVDLAKRRVQIEPRDANAQELGAAITRAGYTPVPVEEHAARAVAPARSGGCCCGSGTRCRS